MRSHHCWKWGPEPQYHQQINNRSGAVRGHTVVCVERVEQGTQNTRAVACELNVNFSTISRLHRRFREFGSTSNRPHNRRPHVTTPAQDLHIQHLLTSKIVWDQPPGQLLQQSVCITKEFLHKLSENRLREAHLHARRPHRGLDLTAVRRRNWLEWMKNKQCCSVKIRLRLWYLGAFHRINIRKVNSLVWYHFQSMTTYFIQVCCLKVSTIETDYI